jgi:hypothetical protein
MARLPHPGGDKGNWGDVLNEYLSQSLDTGGTLKADTVGNAQVSASAAIAQSKIANLTTDLAGKATPASVTSAIASNNATTPWNYGVYPKVIWNGTSWPSRASILPAGYTGAVEYWSPTDSAATSPLDRITGDIWTRVGTA